MSHTSYPESAMNVAVHMGDGVVKVYGHEHNGFRSLLHTRMPMTVPAAISFCARYNDDQRKGLGLMKS